MDVATEIVRVVDHTVAEAARRALERAGPGARMAGTPAVSLGDFGRQIAAALTSQPMSRGIEPSLRSASSTAVLWNQRWFKLPLRRHCGVMSKSAPAPIRMVPGLLKLDWPCSLDERSELRIPLRPLIETARPPPAKGMVWRIQ